ncbi:hypothetical protein BDZ91DRAFT_748509 [Kalaharituber pfeilii]|nr:hypothetical protein BDZ91DRAFT_748509 [Kalaharituber pfeilii]
MDIAEINDSRDEFNQIQTVQPDHKSRAENILGYQQTSQIKPCSLSLKRPRDQHANDSRRSYEPPRAAHIPYSHGSNEFKLSRSSRRHDQYRANIEQLTQQIEQLTEGSKALKDQIKAQSQILEIYKARNGSLEKQLKDVSSEAQSNAELAETRLKDIRKLNQQLTGLQEKLCTVNEAYTTEVKKMEASYNREVERKRQKFQSMLKERDSENSALRQSMQEMDQQIVRLTRDVARFSNERPEAQRDDFYYERHIANIGRSIQGWVMQYYFCGNPSSQVLEAFSGCEVRDGLVKRLGENWMGIFSSKPVECLQVYLMHEICEHIFEPFLLGLVAAGDLDLMKIVQANMTKEKCANWRMWTVQSLTEGETAWSQRAADKIDMIANQIVERLRPLVLDMTTYKPVPRTKRLKLILENAAKLAVETQKEPSIFRWQWYETGAKCAASLMSDIQGERSDAELEESGAVVDMTVYPAVLRFPLDSEQRVVVLKSRILADFPLPDALTDEDETTEQNKTVNADETTDQNKTVNADETTKKHETTNQDEITEHEQL